ncbi:hypothetical protein SDJN03_25969, partial [Cucurbita argyrosperma subsp. sororia]
MVLSLSRASGHKLSMSMSIFIMLKVKAQRLLVNHFDDLNFMSPRFPHEYSRRQKEPRPSFVSSSVYGSLDEKLQLGSKTVMKSEAQ